MPDVLQSDQIPDDTDTWVLRQKERNVRISLYASALLDKLKMEIGPDESLPTGREAMRLVKLEGKSFWYVVCYVGGRRKRFSTRCRRRKDAELVLETLLRRNLAAVKTLPVGQCHTLGEVLRKYLDEHSRGIKASYERDYVSARNILRDTGDIRLDELTPAVVSDWQSKRRRAVKKNGRPITPRTVNLERSLLHRALQIARDQWCWIDENPVRRVPKIPYDGRRDRVYSAEEQVRILQTCDDLNAPWFKDYLKCLLFTGFRKSELLSLRCGQVLMDREPPVIRITRSKSKISMDYPLALDVLKEIFGRLCAGRPADAPVFVTGEGRLLTRDAVQYWWCRVRDRAQIENARIHDWRHSYATRCHEAGIDDLTIKCLLGQRTLAVTHQYIHPTMQTMVDRMKMLERQESTATKLPPFKENLLTLN